MKKIIYPKVGGPESIKIVEIKRNKIGENQVRIRVHRAGINFADLMMRQGLYGSAPKFPFTPGYEVSGVISELGPGVKNLQIDQRVIGLTGFGGYSEEVIIDSMRVIVIPDNVSFDQAAAIPVTY